MENFGNLKELDIATLESLVREYPWFACARQVLMEKMWSKGREHFEMQIGKCSAFLQNRQRLYLLKLEPEQDDDASVIDFDEINREFNEITGAILGENNKKSAESGENGPKYIVLGGDYFTKDDFAQLEDVNSFKIGKLGANDKEFNFQTSDNQVVDLDEGDRDIDDFYTETLARIYAEQGYYEEAIKVYAKLILLYPEKSAYFATLVNEVKSKNN